MGMVVINNLLAGLAGKALPTLVSILLVSPWDAQLDPVLSGPRMPMMPEIHGRNHRCVHALSVSSVGPYWKLRKGTA
jgi:hypothetical protein